MRKKILSFLLALCLLAAGTAVPAASAKTPPDGKVAVTEFNNGSRIIEAGNTRDAFNYLESHSDESGETIPGVVVGGIMQSITYMYKTNANGEKEILKGEDGYLIMESGDMAFMIDNPALKKAIAAESGTLLRFLLTGSNRGLDGSVARIFDAGMSSHYFKPDGTRAAEDITFEVEEYPYSLAVAATKENSLYRYSQEGAYKYSGGGPTELGYITSQIDMREYCDLVGYENVYYFAYESFGDTYEVARRLNDYIENVVKAQTGAEKINLVFISLGGTIGTAYFDLYAHTGEIDELHKVIFADSAIDGSYLLGDIMGLNLNLYDKDYLCTEFIPALLDMRHAVSQEYLWLGYLGGIVLRALPQRWFEKLIDSAAQGLKDSIVTNLVANCPSMWALVPGAQYAQLAEEYLAGSEHAALKEKTDRYRDAQAANSTTMPWIVENTDTLIFAICGYGLHLPSPIDSNRMSSDFIINASSGSMGGTFPDAGTTFTDEYLAGAADPRYISPNRNADLNTSYMKDYIWLIDGQSHLDLPRGRESVIRMSIWLAYDDTITDARVNNGGYPQFNEFRDTNAIRAMLVMAYENPEFIAAHPMGTGTATAFNTLRDEANALIADKVWDTVATDALAVRMADFLLDNFGYNEGWTTSEQKTETQNKTSFFKYLNDLADRLFNPRLVRR